MIYSPTLDNELAQSQQTLKEKSVALARTLMLIKLAAKKMQNRTALSRGAKRFHCAMQTPPAIADSANMIEGLMDYKIQTLAASDTERFLVQNICVVKNQTEIAHATRLVRACMTLASGFDKKDTKLMRQATNDAGQSVRQLHLDTSHIFQQTFIPSDPRLQHAMNDYVARVAMEYKAPELPDTHKSAQKQILLLGAVT